MSKKLTLCHWNNHFMRSWVCETGSSSKEELNDRTAELLNTWERALIIPIPTDNPKEIDKILSSYYDYKISSHDLNIISKEESCHCFQQRCYDKK